MDMVADKDYRRWHDVSAIHRVSKKTVPTYFFAPCLSNMNRFQ